MGKMKLTDFDKVRELIDHHRSLQETLSQVEAAASVSLSFDGHKTITASRYDGDIDGFADAKHAIRKMLRRQIINIESQLLEYGVTQ
jgi:hypothetical protein